jgi:dihydroorotate dehydrogenase electron transfer subunit
MTDVEQGTGLLLAGPTTNGAIVRAREFESHVVAVEPEMGDSALITLTTPPGMAASLRPGQFVDVLCRVDGSFDPLLRRPYSIYRSDPAADRIVLLVRPFGRGSTWLAARQPGEVLDVLGPLGNAFEISPRSTRLLMVAGGVGAAPLVFLSDLAVARGLSVTFLMGSAGEAGLLSADQLPRAVEYVVATDDGSRGHRGFITDLLPDYLRWADQIFACGPEPMFVSLRNTIHPHRIGGKPTVQVSMERTMACGLGACLGCVVETRRGMQTSCVQGPIYDMDEVIWQ